MVRGGVLSPSKIITRAKVKRRELFARTPLGRRFLLPSYHYAFSPPQLAALSQIVDDTESVRGSFIEIGVGWGATTIWLNRHLAARSRAPSYIAMDTFSGFTERDVEYEHGVGRTYPFDDFDFNSETLFRLTMEHCGLENVRVVNADAASYPYTELPHLAFALVDVDLYRPSLAAIAGVWPRVAEGGIVVVDDCSPLPGKWQGAGDAYREFCRDEQLPEEYVEGKLGLLRK
jgi:predicted O-methyltransferase YrrM